jgi:N-methylhydantoinase A
MALAASGTTHRVSADIGGTFTDIVVAAHDGSCLTKKVLSTPDDFARGIVEGLSQLMTENDLDPSSLQEVIHASTVAANAILESKGARTALITTRGFRDVLELRRLRVPLLYDLQYRPPAPMVERRLRIEVDERMGAKGDVLHPLDEAGVDVAVGRMREERVEAVAVCLIHSYRNPEHERRVGELISKLAPEIHLSLSVDVLPEIREYERTSTTVINAYVGPTVRAYLQSLSRQLADREITAPLLIMQSNGGIMSAAAAAEHPVQIVESGPAAGVIGAQVMGRRSGIGNVITFDMGGTTAKASIIEDGEVSRTTEYEVGAGISLSSRLVKGRGHALKLPVLDIAEVGAGGGSIVWLDRVGSLKVGPQSAGAAPGPACYGAGGTEATVTDANVVLGYINPVELAGGELKLRPELATAALKAKLAGPLGLSLYEVAYGVYGVVNANMIRAIKAVSTYRGRDPRDFTLFAFGGSGPIHAAAIARELGITRVVVPPSPGLFSAIGLLEAQIEHHLVRTRIARLNELEVGDLRAAFAELEHNALGLLSEDGTDPENAVLQRQADLRYVGQAYELTVPVAESLTSAADLDALAGRFGQEHERTYGHRAVDEPVELVNVRVIARVDSGGRGFVKAPLSSGMRTSRRPAYFSRELGEIDTPVLSRGALSRDSTPGPMVIEDYDATTVVPPGWFAHMDENGSIIIDEYGLGA